MTRGAGELELIPDPALRVDAERRIVEANTAARQLLRVSNGQLIGDLLEDAIDPRTRELQPMLIEGWHRSVGLGSVTRIPEQDMTVRRLDGSDVRVFVTGRFERDGTGRLTGAVVVLRDASRRTRKQVAGIEIVSTVSHELRSPLTSVKGYTSMLLNRWDRFTDEQKKMMLGQINHDADRVTRMITELLDVSRLETGRLVLRRELLDMGALANSVVEKVGLAYAGLDCTVEFPEDFPRVFADPHKIEQVLVNLVENAAKYGSNTGMRVLGEVVESAVTVSVIDRGKGIPAQDLPRVFTKFFRREEGRPTGTGLGLWISRGLVEAHGGHLEATSEPGAGCRFSFSLPTKALEEFLAEFDV